MRFFATLRMTTSEGMTEKGFFKRPKKNQMTNREPDFNRVRKMLFLEGEPDCIPVVEIVVNEPIKELFLGKKIKNIKDDIEFWYKAGYDYYSYCPPYEDKLHIKFIKDGQVERNWAVEGEGPIQSIKDFENHPWPDIKDIDFSGLEEANKSLPEGMKIIARAGEIFVYTWELMGYEKFSYALVENPRLAELLIEKIGNFIYNICEIEVQFENVGALWYSDDIAYTEGLMVSPQFLRKYLFPWIKKIGDLAKKRNIPCLYHTDGKLWDVMDDIIACGINGLHPIEPKAMDAREVKKRYGNRLCLVGNIDLDLLVRKDPEYIRGMVKDKIKELGQGGGYCAGSSNTIPEYVPLENYIAMQEAIFEYGKYPIK